MNSVASAEIARINSHFQGEDGFPRIPGKKDAGSTRESQDFNLHKAFY